MPTNKANTLVPALKLRQQAVVTSGGTIFISNVIQEDENVHYQKEKITI
jgi:hypothetical protein